MGQDPGLRKDDLTPTQRRILALARSGLTNEEIASTLGTTRNAVRFHLKNLHASLDTGGDRQALAASQPGVLRRLLMFVPGVVTPQTLATVAVLGLSFAGLVGIRAAYFRADDESVTSKEAKLSGSREDPFCLGKMAADTPGALDEEGCFRTEAEALAHLAKLNEP